MEATREIYWNVGHGVILPMYLLFAAAAAACAWGFCSKLRVYRSGLPLDRSSGPARRLARAASRALAQLRVVLLRCTPQCTDRCRMICKDPERGVPFQRAPIETWNGTVGSCAVRIVGRDEKGDPNAGPLMIGSERTEDLQEVRRGGCRRWMGC